MRLRNILSILAASMLAASMPVPTSKGISSRSSDDSSSDAKMSEGSPAASFHRRQVKGKGKRLSDSTDSTDLPDSKKLVTNHLAAQALALSPQGRTVVFVPSEGAPLPNPLPERPPKFGRESAHAQAPLTCAINDGIDGKDVSITYLGEFPTVENPGPNGRHRVHFKVFGTEDCPRQNPCNGFAEKGATYMMKNGKAVEVPNPKVTYAAVSKPKSPFKALRQPDFIPTYGRYKGQVPHPEVVRKRRWVLENIVRAYNSIPPVPLPPPLPPQQQQHPPAAAPREQQQHPPVPAPAPHGPQQHPQGSGQQSALASVLPSRPPPASGPPHQFVHPSKLLVNPPPQPPSQAQVQDPPRTPSPHTPKQYYEYESPKSGYKVSPKNVKINPPSPQGDTLYGSPPPPLFGSP